MIGHPKVQDIASRAPVVGGITVGYEGYTASIGLVHQSASWDFFLCFPTLPF